MELNPSSLQCQVKTTVRPGRLVNIKQQIPWLACWLACCTSLTACIPLVYLQICGASTVLQTWNTEIR